MTEDAVTFFNTHKMQVDMAALGWERKELAAAARISEMTVSRFFRRERQTVKTARKLAGALGHHVRRYVISRPRQRTTTTHHRAAVSA